MLALVYLAALLLHAPGKHNQSSHGRGGRKAKAARVARKTANFNTRKAMSGGFVRSRGMSTAKFRSNR